MSEHVDNSHDYEQASEVSLLSFFMHPAVQAKIRNLESVVGDAPENSSMRADYTKAAVEAAYELIPVEKFANKDIVVYGQIFHSGGDENFDSSRIECYDRAQFFNFALTEIENRVRLALIMHVETRSTDRSNEPKIETIAVVPHAEYLAQFSFRQS